MSLGSILNFKIKIGNTRQVVSMHIPVCEPMMIGKVKNTGRGAKGKLIEVYEFCLFNVHMWKMINDLKCKSTGIPYLI